MRSAAQEGRMDEQEWINDFKKLEETIKKDEEKEENIFRTHMNDIGFYFKHSPKYIETLMKEGKVNISIVLFSEKVILFLEKIKKAVFIAGYDETTFEKFYGKIPHSTQKIIGDKKVLHHLNKENKRLINNINDYIGYWKNNSRKNEFTGFFSRFRRISPYEFITKLFHKEEKLNSHMLTAIEEMYNQIEKKSNRTH